VRAVHLAGSYWAPGFANYLLLLQSTDIFTYDLTHCPGAANTATATLLLDTIVRLVEGCGEGDPSLQELVATIKGEL